MYRPRPSADSQHGFHTFSQELASWMNSAWENYVKPKTNHAMSGETMYSLRSKPRRTCTLLMETTSGSLWEICQTLRHACQILTWDAMRVRKKRWLQMILRKSTFSKKQCDTLSRTVPTCCTTWNQPHAKLHLTTLRRADLLDFQDQHNKTNVLLHRHRSSIKVIFNDWGTGSTEMHSLSAVMKAKLPTLTHGTSITNDKSFVEKHDPSDLEPISPGGGRTFWNYGKISLTPIWQRPYTWYNRPRHVPWRSVFLPIWF